MPSTPVPRLARAVIFAAVCVTLAAAGHGLASARPVPPFAVAGGFAVIVAVATALAGAERSLPTILGGLLGGQFVLHALFAAAPQGPHMEHGAPVADGAHGGTAMTLAHLAAAVVSAWWLRRGERALWALTRKVAAAAGRPVRALLSGPAPLPPRPRVRAASAVRLRRLSALLLSVASRRGPPAPSTT